MTENNSSTSPPDPASTDSQVRPLIPNSDDEIDLVDLGVSLWRRWKLMLIIFLACTGLGLVIAFALPHVPAYSYTAVVGLGSYTTPGGNVTFVVTPGSAADTLNSGLIQSALLRYASEHRVDPLKVKVVAKMPGKSNTIVLTGKGPKELQDAFETVEKNAATLLAGSTDAQINVLRSSLEQSLTMAQIALARIDDPQQIKAERAALQQKLSSAQANQVNLTEQLKVLGEKQNRLNQAAKLYQGQLKALSAYLVQARKTSLTASRAGTPTQAMAMLLINNQLQSNLQRMNGIEQKLTVTLPQEVVAVEAAMAANRQQQIVQKNVLTQATANLASFEVEHQRKVQAQEAVISNLKTRLSNIQKTRLIVPPSRSLRHTGRSRSIVAILGAVLGVMLALLAVALANYVAAVRRRLAPEDS